MTKYRSKLEERVADLLSNLGVSFEYESTRVPYEIQFNYTPDFILPSGVMLETKGYWDPEDRRKVLAVKKCNPDLDLRMVFKLHTTKSIRVARLPMHNSAISTTYHGRHSPRYRSSG